MKNFAMSLGTTGALILMVTLAISFATRGYSGPSEENISGSPSLRTPRSRSTAGHVERKLPAETINEPSVGGSDQERADNEGEVPSAVSPQASVPTPRAVFPYTVRAGDTPSGIGALFGVPVADLLRLNHLHPDSGLMIGDTLRIPNPFLARERVLSSELDRVTAEKQAAEEQAQKNQQAISDLRAKAQDLNATNKQYQHDLYVLPWWRATALLAAGAAALMLGIMLVAVLQWFIARSRFRAVAEMNESLRRLDFKYKAALAKAELRFQELYGRRRPAVEEGHERTKTPDEIEIEQLNRQLKEVLERHLQRLEPSSLRTGRARWRERLADVGAPMEPRSIRR